MIRRRQFITLLGGAAVAWPLAVRAQGAGDLPRVAVLSPDPATTDRLPVFLGRLGELGYVDGRNIRLDTRFAGNRLDRLPALAAELVKARPPSFTPIPQREALPPPEQQPAFRSS